MAAQAGMNLCWCHISSRIIHLPSQYEVDNTCTCLAPALNNLCQTLINWTIHFQYKGCWVVMFNFIKLLKSILYANSAEPGQSRRSGPALIAYDGLKYFSEQLLVFVIVKTIITIAYNIRSVIRLIRPITRLSHK